MAFISFIFDEQCKENNRRFIIRIDGGHTSTITRGFIKSIESGKHDIQINTKTDLEKKFGAMQKVYAQKSNNAVERAFFDNAAKTSQGETWRIPFTLGEDDAFILRFPGNVGEAPTYETVTLSGEEIRQYMLKIKEQESIKNEQKKQEGEKSIKALLLWLFLGAFGLHRRCLNKKWSIIYPLTLGCFGILPFIDLFTIIIPALNARKES